jgi:hypothetical protein
MARPTTCTPEITAAVCDALKAGGYAVDAAVAAGVSETTFYEWMKRGKRGEAPFAEFAESVKGAKRIRTHTLCVAISSDPSWQSRAWMLERTDPKRFGRNDRVKLDAKVEGSTTVMPLPSMVAATERILAALKEQAAEDADE